MQGEDCFSLPPRLLSGRAATERTSRNAWPSKDAMTRTRSALMTGLLLTLTAGISGLAAPTQASPEKIFEAARLKAGQTVCEIGAGVGDLSLAAARAVGTEGRVFANELEWRLPALRIRIADRNLSTITVVTGEPTKTGIPDAACDAVIMKDVYHHFVDPAAMNKAIGAALKPGGRLVIVDFTPPGKEAATPAGRGVDGTHGVLPATIIAEVKAAGFSEVPDGSTAERWFVLVFVKAPVERLTSSGYHARTGAEARALASTRNQSFTVGARSPEGTFKVGDGPPQPAKGAKSLATAKPHGVLRAEVLG